MFLALAGGVGGAKLASGLAAVLPAGELVIAVNTGDDFEHVGLHVAPDLDSVMYALAGLNDTVRGWGLAGESWRFLDALKRLGGADWFMLGDQDLATHVERSWRLRGGATLSAVTAHFCAALGITQTMVPMSDDPVRTIVDTNLGLLPFQDYFVRHRCTPTLKGLLFDGVDDARISDGLRAALDNPTIEGIIICPSNPLLSILPILSLPGMRRALAARRVPCVAVSPLIGGKAVKGPAAKNMTELGLPTTPEGIADFYAGLIDGLVIDPQDAPPARTGLAVESTPTLMRDADDRARLASATLAFTRSLVRAP